MLSTFAFFAIVFLAGLAAGSLLMLIAIFCFRKPSAPRPLSKERFTIMSKYKLPDDQPDFEIEVTVAGKDSEGNAADLTGATLEVDNSNPTAIEGTVKSSTPADDKKSLKVVVGVHVGSPSPDLGVIGYKAKNAAGDLVGAGSDEFLIGTGALAVATISSTVPFTPEPDAPPAP